MRSIGMKRSQRGDTLIEVLVSMAVLGALISISFAVMSRGFASAQNSLDRTETQALLSGQASLIRAAHARALNGDTRYWDAIVLKTVNVAAIDSTKLADGCATSLVGNQKVNAFYFNPATVYNSANPLPNGPLAPAAYYATQPVDDSKLVRQGNLPAVGDGIWVESYKDSNNFYTFYIKSCWRSAYGDGSDVLRQAKTVVRLYAQ